MTIDRFNEFSNAQAVTATAVSTDQLDLKAARDMAAGKTLWFIVHLVVAMTDAGSDSTVTVTVETDTTSAFGSVTVQQTLGTFAAVSAAGTLLRVPMAIYPVRERFMQLRYTVANGNLTTGSFSAYITTVPQNAQLYADNKDIQGPT